MDRITKVAFKDGKVVIHTSRVIVGESEKDTVLKSYQEPHADFLKALSELVAHARDILELPVVAWQDRIKVTGVSYSFSEATEVEGAVITGQVALDECDAPFCFNTPHLPFEQYSENGCAKLMPDEAREALQAFRNEAYEFLRGKTAQADLFSGKNAAAGERGDETKIGINGGPEHPPGAMREAFGMGEGEGIVIDDASVALAGAPDTISLVTPIGADFRSTDEGRIEALTDQGKHIARTAVAEGRAEEAGSPNVIKMKPRPKREPRAEA